MAVRQRMALSIDPNVFAEAVPSRASLLARPRACNMPGPVPRRLPSICESFSSAANRSNFIAFSRYSAIIFTASLALRLQPEVNRLQRYSELIEPMSDGLLASLELHRYFCGPSA